MASRADDLLNEILQLPAPERLDLVERIWESLAVSADQVPVPDWHREELDRRLSDPDDQPVLDWSQVRARLKDDG